MLLTQTTIAIAYSQCLLKCVAIRYLRLVWLLAGPVYIHRDPGDTPHLGVGAENSGFGVGYRARAWCRDQSPGPLAKA